MIGRLAMIAGGASAIALTAPFALSYFLAYGLPGEVAPGWLAALQAPLTQAGLLDGSIATYERYGQLYLVAWVVALGGLIVGVRHAWPTLTRRWRRAWTVLVTALGVVALGILGDYAGLGDAVTLVGFVSTGLGFLAAAVGCGLLGVAMRRDDGASMGRAVLVGALGLLSVIGGLALVGHIPSGPGLGFAVAAVVVGLVGRPSPTPTRRDGPERVT